MRHGDWNAFSKSSCQSISFAVLGPERIAVAELREFVDGRIDPAIAIEIRLNYPGLVTAFLFTFAGVDWVVGAFFWMTAWQRRPRRRPPADRLGPFNPTRLAGELEAWLRSQGSPSLLSAPPKTMGVMATCSRRPNCADATGGGVYQLQAEAP